MKCENERFESSHRMNTVKTGVEMTVSVTVGMVQLLVIPEYALKNVN